MTQQTSADALCLHLVLSQGQSIHTVFPLYAGQRLTLGQLLAQSPVAVPQDQQTAAEQCRISSHGASADGGVLWWFENFGDELACRHNQRRLAQKERVRLSENDVLEAGLARFIVKRTTPSLHEAHSTPRSVQPGPPTPPEIHGSFALTDLASALHADDLAVPAGNARASSPHGDARQDPFSGLTDPIHPPDAAFIASNGTDAGTPTVLQNLHSDYLRTLRNPHAVPEPLDWSLDDPAPQRRQDILEDLTQHASSYDSLHALLGETTSIDTVMAGLEILSDQNILAPEPPPNVLRLFAPPELMQAANGLPSLTRHEHHILTADSAAMLDQRRAPLP